MWQSKRVDPTGLVWLGARYYDPKGGRFLSPDPVSHPLCLDLYTYANGDPINNIDPTGRYSSAACKGLGTFLIDTLSSHQFQGGMRALGGLVEAKIGMALTMTVLGAPIGAFLIVHGMDNFQAGAREAFTNQSVDTATVLLLQNAGMSHNAAHITNDMTMILGTMGATAITRTVTASASRLQFSTAIKELQSKKIELNRFHQAARNLSEVGQNNIRILRGWAKSKGWTKAPNSGGPEKWGIMRNSEFEWRLKIKPETSNRLGLHKNSNVSRFDARLLSDITGQSYINPFTQEIGNWRVGTHLPIE